jgi:hypothetical protein
MAEAQELRDMLAATLDTRLPATDRRNVIYMLIQNLQALDQELTREGATPNETT